VTSNGQIHIKNQKFGNVEKQRTIFTGSNFEAIVGLAYPALAEKGVKPVFDEMIDQKLLEHNIFAFYLTTKQAENMGIMSDLTFGYYDKAKFKGEMKWYPVDFQYMYGVKLDDIKVNGQSTGVCANRPSGCLITFDSGTSLMSVPTFASQILMQNKIPTANFVLPCQSQTQFGELTLVIGGDEYVLSNEEWMFPAEQVKFAQGGQTLNFKMGPVGPQIMAQVDSGEQVWESFEKESLVQSNATS
jgi:cathepsin D